MPPILPTLGITDYYPFRHISTRCHCFFWGVRDVSGMRCMASGGGGYARTATGYAAFMVAEPPNIARPDKAHPTRLKTS